MAVHEPPTDFAQAAAKDTASRADFGNLPF
jgi:hypothetical protein